ncbi:MAG: glutathionylspermidine synthase family protein [Polyangiaceae bacterium]
MSPSSSDPDPVAQYDAFAAKVTAGGIVLDPWLDGAPRLASEPRVIDAATFAELKRVGEDVAELFNEACALVDDDDDLVDSFFGLSPAQKVMWDASRPHWHGFARADVFRIGSGYAITELNCDTPTGEAEAVVLGALAKEAHPELIDPNAELERRFVAMAERLIEQGVGGGQGKRRSGVRAAPPRAIGLVYPTEFTEDLAVIRLYRTWFNRCGYEVVLGSPYNLGLSDGGAATLFHRPLAAVLRHYKTDAWGERESAWLDEELKDTAALARPLGTILKASIEKRTAVINPFGAILPQNKRCMAFMWEHIHRFSTRARGAIERLVPFSSRLETVHTARLHAERRSWVVKSDYGAEGDEVLIGREMTDDEWRAALAQCRPGRWIAQRHLVSGEGASGEGDEDEADLADNWGVFVVAGEAAGLYLRTQRGGTDERALSVPVLVAP